MAKIENPIGWCDDTTNAVTGCDKVSPGCKNCYAATGTRARVLRAQGIETWGPKGVRHPVAEYATKLRRLNKLCICDKCHTSYPMKDQQVGGLGYCVAVGGCGGTLRRIRLFADSNSDWLDDKWPVETLANFLNEIRLAPNLDVQLLTKRPDNFFDRLKQVAMIGDREDGLSDKTVTKFAHCFAEDWRHNHVVPHNVWLGVSVENQAMADLRIPQLLKIPAAVRFLSCEPLLENICLTYPESLFPNGPDRCCNGSDCGCQGQPIDAPLIYGVNWVIVGGESGPKRRDVPMEAIISVHDQCKAAGVACYVKQDVSLVNGTQGRIPDAIFNCKEFPR